MLLQNFLKQVLPQSGYKCWVSIDQNKAVIQGFVTTIEELAAKLLAIDASGADSYFACASYETDRNRRGGNARAAKAFWADIDVGEGKPYATVQEAVQATDDFCTRTGLPIPGMVYSGGGLHAYWCLGRELARTEWCHFAQRFKLLTITQGFHCDPSRTADIASILRAPGTKNYKLSGNPRAVEIDDIDLFLPVNAEEILSLLSGDISKTQINTPHVVPAQPINTALTAGMSKAFDPSVGVAQGCRGSTQLKYAGELVARGYPEEEVIAKCRAWNQLCTPPQDDKEVVRVVRSAISMHMAKHPAPPAPVDVPQLPALPYGYGWGAQHQLTVKVKEMADDGKEVDKIKIVSQLPVYLEAILNHEGTGQKNSYLFRQFHSSKGWLQFPMNAKEFNSQNWYGEWFEHGGELMTGMDKYFKTYVREASNMLRESGKEVTRYSQFGWKEDDNSFLVGKWLCKADGTVATAQGTDKLTPLMEAMTPAPNGSLEAWSAAANRLFTPGSEAHSFILLASFAAPLMKFCVDEGNGGSILSIVSEESGHGKTPMAAAAASVWGKLESTRVTGNFTENRRIEDLVRHCHLPQVQEEMAYGDPLIAAQSVEKFTSGTDRGRLNRGGESTGMPEFYQTIVMSMSNKSLYELVRMANGPMSRRVFEIEIERPTKEMLENLGGTARDMMRNCGYAGLQFIRYIVNPEVRKFIAEQLSGTGGQPGVAVMKYRELLQTKPEHRFIVWLLAATEVAGIILNHYKILQFDVARIMNWASEEADTKINGDDLDSNSPFKKLQKFVADNLDSCLIVSDTFKSGSAQMPIRTPNKHLHMRMEIKTRTLYISTETLKEWCAKHNISFIRFGKELYTRNVVSDRNRSITLGAGTGIPSVRTLCWEINMAHPDISGEMSLVETQKDDESAAS